jgi:hypothetical protein
MSRRSPTVDPSVAARVWSGSMDWRGGSFRMTREWGMSIVHRDSARWVEDYYRVTASSVSLCLCVSPAFHGTHSARRHPRTELIR